MGQNMSTPTSEGGLLAGYALSRSIEVEHFQEEDFQPSKTENDNSTSYVPPTEEEYLQLLKRIKELEQSNRSVETPLNVEEDDDFDNERPKRIMLFGQAFAVDENFHWRVKWGQRGAGLSSFCTFACYLVTKCLVVMLFAS